MDRVVFSRSPTRRQHVVLKELKLPYVEIVAMYGGADGTLVRAEIEAEWQREIADRTAAYEER